jgi:hypothetical protein
MSRREVAEHVKGYAEGRRLMRHGDGADEWLGMRLVRENLLALTDLGYDEHGRKATLAERAEVLRAHGLREYADALAVADAPIRAGTVWDRMPWRCWAQGHAWRRCPARRTS